MTRTARRAYQSGMNTPTITLYYDGLCPLCSREIAHYRERSARDPSIVYLDITAPDFDARAHGLDPSAVHRVMHVKDGDTLHTGIDAFIALWRRMPGFGWLARLARIPFVYLPMWIGYSVFAQVRPYLPRRKRDDCTTGVCSR